jgi:MoaA/NifB/PqqE/SkfB family radical SAM enzyme
MANINELKKTLSAYYLKKDSPFIANWIITSQCNCKCPFCELGVKNLYNEKNELSTERALKLIKELKDVGIKYITLSGGEVFLRRDIFEIIKELKRNKIKVGIVSNGLLLNSFSKDRIEFLKKHLDTLVISIDSSIPEEHNKFRQTPKLFEIIMKGIDKLQSNGFTNITFESIIMGSNYKQIPEIIKLAKEKKIRKVMFRPINIAPNFPNLKAISNKKKFADYNVDEIIKYIDLGIKTAKHLKVDTDLFFNRKWIIEYFKNLDNKSGFFHDRVIKNYFCFIPFCYIVINYNGGLLPCLLLKEKGNVKSSELKKERSKSNDIRERLGKRKFFPICNFCFDQANNNFRFSVLCNPIRNINTLKSLYSDIKSVKKRFNG